MDSLTQIVLGAAVGEAVLGKKVGNKAMLYGAIGGTIPDLDAIAGNFTDVITATEIHRGFTHSIVFSIIFAPIFGWIISKIEKTAAVNWKNWSWLMFWALFTHPLLDAHTTWGTQLFWPFDLRLAYKNIFVIDPLYTLPFLVFLILALRRKKDDPKRAKFNRTGIIISCIYLLLITPGLKWYSWLKFEDALKKQNITYNRMETRPSPFNAILWSANVETEKDFLLAEYSIFDSKPITFDAYPKNHELAGTFEDKPNFNRLKAISKYWYILDKKKDDLYFYDLRFGKLGFRKEDPFSFRYRLYQQDGVVKAEELPRETSQAKNLLSSLWNRIKGN